MNTLNILPKITFKQMFPSMVMLDFWNGTVMHEKNNVSLLLYVGLYEQVFTETCICQIWSHVSYSLLKQYEEIGLKYMEPSQNITAIILKLITYR